MLKYFWSIPLLFLVLSSCDPNRIYDTYSPIPKTGWDYEQRLSFEAGIADTSQLYNLYVNIRHTDDYAYSNLWIKIYTTYPSGKLLENRVNLPLADKSGKWLGSGLGSVISNQVLIQANARLPEKGNYRFEIQQDMRSNPLPEVMDIGIRVEKTP